MLVHRSWLFVLCSVACASAPTSQAPVSPAPQRPALQVPSDPATLISGPVDAVIAARVDQLRVSPYATRLQTYAAGAACLSAGDLQHWVQISERAALASRSGAEREEWLLALKGRFTEQDARALLELAGAREPSAATQSAPVAGFAVWDKGLTAASLLDAHTLVIGSVAWLREALAALTQPNAAFTAQPLWRGLGTEVECPTRSACVLSTAHGRQAKRLHHTLAAVGAGGLGGQLQAADSALGLQLTDAAELGFVAELDSVNAAATARDRLDNWLRQAGFAARLAGLPDVLGDVRASARAQQLRAQLTVSAADLQEILDRLEPLLAQSTAHCERR